jgi:hypothetical protein
MSLIAEYSRLYKIAMTIFGTSIPQFADINIGGFISNENWLIIPKSDERNLKEAASRDDPNLYFSFDSSGEINIGIFCNTLESVRRLRNLLHSFHTVEKQKMVENLLKLSPEFQTEVMRKVKENYHGQKPVYEPVLTFKTNTISEEKLGQTFQKIDEIMQDSDNLMKIDHKTWRVLAPVVELARITVKDNGADFRKALSELKPIYEIVLRLKTDDEINRELKIRDQKQVKQRQQEFSIFVEKLKNEGITGEKYREAIRKFNEAHK